MSGDIRLEFTVITDEVEAKLRMLGDRAGAVTAPPLYLAASKIMTTSKEVYCPIEFGALKTSGYVEMPKVSPTGSELTMGYGGAARAYAHRQHEELGWHHPNGKSAKYLEIPVTHGLPDVIAAIGAAVDRAVMGHLGVNVPAGPHPTESVGNPPMHERTHREGHPRPRGRTA